MAEGKKKPMTLEETEALQRERDLKGLPGYNVYEKESHFTTEYFCAGCGDGPIPCSIDCPQCGHARPEENFDEEQEGTRGRHRVRAGYRG